MEKLLEILWSILDDKWIKHRFDIKSGFSEIVRQEIKYHRKIWWIVWSF